MVAGLQGHIDGGAPGFCSGGPEGMHLGMGGSGLGMKPRGNEPVIFNHHRADTGIGRGAAKPLSRLPDGQLHPGAVVFHCGVSSGPPSMPFNSAMNSLKSLNCRYTEAKRT